MVIKFSGPSVNYFVDDVKKAAAFYIRNFGFVEKFRTPTSGEPVHIEIKLENFILGLASKKSAKAMVGLDLDMSTVSKAEVILWTEKVDEVYKELTSKNLCTA